MHYRQRDGRRTRYSLSGSFRHVFFFLRNACCFCARPYPTRLTGITWRHISLFSALSLLFCFCFCFFCCRFWERAASLAGGGVCANAGRCEYICTVAVDGCWDRACRNKEKRRFRVSSVEPGSNSAVPHGTNTKTVMAAGIVLVERNKTSFPHLQRRAREQLCK